MMQCDSTLDVMQFQNLFLLGATAIEDKLQDVSFCAMMFVCSLEQQDVCDMWHVI